MPKYDDDEALARALQEEYSREFQRQQRRSSQQQAAAGGQQQQRGSGGNGGGVRNNHHHSSESLRPARSVRPTNNNSSSINNNTNNSMSNSTNNNSNNNQRRKRPSRGGRQQRQQQQQQQASSLSGQQQQYQHQSAQSQSLTQAQYAARQNHSSNAAAPSTRAPARTSSATQRTRNSRTIPVAAAEEEPEINVNGGGGGGSVFFPANFTAPAPTVVQPPPTNNTNPYLQEEEEVVLNDEEYARRLERELRLEEEGVIGTTANNNNNDITFAPAVPPPGQQQQPPPQSDEEFARRLQIEIEREEEQFASAANSKYSKRDSTDTPITSSSVTSSISDNTAGDVNRGGGVTVSSNGVVLRQHQDDEQIAVRVEQELRDEELARRLSTAEEERLSAYRARQYNNNQASRAAAAAAASSNQRRGCTWRRCCLSYLMPLIIVAGAAAGVVWYFMYGKDTLPDFWPSPEDFRNEDPFANQDTGEVELWRTKGQGLELELISALDNDWVPYFENSVTEWDSGTPDALDLSMSYVDPDPKCDPINFKLKVCNDDYGATMWRGINKILLTDRYIFASAARMNEYYFRGSDDAQKRYTMCHEIGHGFGLPHSDESFTNADLGNCMDYTNNPQANMKPGTYNFEFLSDMYGTVPGSNSSPEVALQEQIRGGGGNRLRRLSREGEEQQDLKIPDWVMEKWRGLEVELDNHSHGAERTAEGWRLLEKNDRMESHEIDIGQGYRIQVHKLLVPN